MRNVMKRTCFAVLLGGLSALLALSPGIQAQPERGAKDPEKNRKGDERLTARDFAEKAASGNQYEIRSGQLAAERTRRDEVKEYAQQMIKDHTRASEELMKAMKDSNIDAEVANRLQPKHRKMLEQLQQARGEGFDELYGKQQLQTHEEAVMLYEQASKGLEEEALKQFATETLPKLKEHQKQAQQLFGRQRQQEERERRN